MLHAIHELALNTIFNFYLRALDSSKQTEADEEKTQTSMTNVSALRPVYARLQSPSFVAGRIAAWQVSSGGGDIQTISQQPRLNAGNICLVGNRRTGGGEFSKAILELSSCPTYALYPGQPIVLKATNPMGRALNVSSVFQVY